MFEPARLAPIRPTVKAQIKALPRRVVATSKTFKQLARLNAAAWGRESPFVRHTVTRSQVAQSIQQLVTLAVSLIAGCGDVHRFHWG